MNLVNGSLIGLVSMSRTRTPSTQNCSKRGLESFKHCSEKDDVKEDQGQVSKLEKEVKETTNRLKMADKVVGQEVPQVKL